MSVARPRGPAGGPRVSYVIGTYPSLTTTFIDREIAALRSLGVEITLVSLRRPRMLLDAAQQRAAADVRYVLPTTALAVLRANLQAVARRPGSYAKAFAALMREPHAGASRLKTALHFLEGVSVASILEDRRGIDLHAHFVDRAAVVAFVAARLLDVSYSVTAHANDIYVAPVLLDLKVREARTVITCTEHNREHLIAVLGAARAPRIRTVYHGLDLGVFQPSQTVPKEPLIASVAQLKEKKGLDFLVKACAVLRDRGLPVRCEIAGDGPLRAELERAIDEQHLRDVVSLRGSLTQADVIDLLRRASVFALPSVIASDGDRDGIPNAILEAMAMGLPVVSTATSGIPEVVQHDVTGFIVPPGDPGAIADAVERLLSDASTSARLGAAGQQLVRSRFDVTHNAAVLMEAWGLPSPSGPLAAQA